MKKILLFFLSFLIYMSCSSKETKKIVHLRYDSLKAIRVVPITLNQDGRSDQITAYLDYLIETSFKKLERFEYIDLNNWSMMRDKPSQIVRINKILKEISRVQSLYQNNRMSRVVDNTEKLLRHMESDFKYFEDLEELLFLKAYLAAGNTLDDGIGDDDLYKNLAIMRPDYVFNTNIFGPEIIKLFNDNLREIKRLRKGTITVVSDPVSAKVYIDGEFVGVTPYDGKYKVGTHYIKVEADGFAPFGKSIKVLPQENPVNAVLEAYSMNRSLNNLRKKMRNYVASDDEKFPKPVIDFLKVAPFDQLLLFKTKAVDSRVYVTLFVYDIPAYALYKKKSFEINLEDKNFKNDFLNNLESILNY